MSSYNPKGVIVSVNEEVIDQSPTPHYDKHTRCWLLYGRRPNAQFGIAFQCEALKEMRAKQGTRAPFSLTAETIFVQLPVAVAWELPKGSRNFKVWGV